MSETCLSELFLSDSCSIIHWLPLVKKKYTPGTNNSQMTIVKN